MTVAGSPGLTCSGSQARSPRSPSSLPPKRKRTRRQNERQTTRQAGMAWHGMGTMSRRARLVRRAGARSYHALLFCISAASRRSRAGALRAHSVYSAICEHRAIYVPVKCFITCCWVLAWFTGLRVSTITPRVAHIYFAARIGSRGDAFSAYARWRRTYSKRHVRCARVPLALYARSR